MPNSDDIIPGTPGNQIPQLQSESFGETAMPGNELHELDNTGAPQFETEQPFANMEVHHHPDIHHKPKPFREFVLEFFMIFLAVTMGFFAESFREHLSESSKESEAIHSLVEDLKADTTAISGVIALNKETAAQIDTLIYALNHYKPSDSANQQLYNLYIVTTTDAAFVPTERTLIQLKNTGTLHVIKDKQMANELANYDAAISSLKGYQKIYDDYNEKCVDEAAHIFNLTYLKYSLGRDGNDSINADTSLVIAPQYRGKYIPLLDARPGVLAKYANAVWYQQLVLLNYRELLKEFKDEQLALLEALNKGDKDE